MLPSVMHREIHETPERLAAFAEANTTPPAWFKHVPATPALIVFIARGSSDHAALYGRYLLEANLGVPVVHAAPSLQTLLHQQISFPPNTLLVAISQSGESTDVIQCLATLQCANTTSLAITNQAKSTLAKTAQAVCLLGAGKERAVAATKTYSLSLAAIYALCSWLRGGSPKAALLKAAKDFQAALKQAPYVEAHAARFTYAPEAAVLGRLLHYASAKEFALKLTETCAMASMGASGADFQHGPIAMLRRGYPAFVLASGDPAQASFHQLLARMEAAHTHPLVLTDHAPLLKDHEGIFVHRSAPAELSPLTLAPVFQLFAAGLSLMRGLSPDAPANLNKVTHTL